LNTAETFEQLAGALQRRNGVGEVGRGGIVGDGRDLGRVIGKGPLEGRQEVLGRDFGKESGVSNGVCHGRSNGFALGVRRGRILQGFRHRQFPFSPRKSASIYITR
jgi:hypothetical protein